MTASLAVGMMKPCAGGLEWVAVWLLLAMETSSPLRLESPISSVKRSFSPLLENMMWVFQRSLFHSASCLVNAWRLFSWRTKSPASNAPSGDG